MLINIKISAETSPCSLLSETVEKALQLVKETKHYLAPMTCEVCMKLFFNGVEIPITSFTSVGEAADYYSDKMENFQKRRKKKIVNSINSVYNSYRQ